MKPQSEIKLLQDAINRKHTNDDFQVLLGFVYGEVVNLPLDGLLDRIWPHVVDLQPEWSI